MDLRKLAGKQTLFEKLMHDAAMQAMAKEEEDLKVPEYYLEYGYDYAMSFFARLDMGCPECEGHQTTPHLREVTDD